MNQVKIRKNGTFYSVFDDDSYILHFFLQYKIKDNKVGFPMSALNKVINILEENSINYKVIGEDREANFKNLNKYQKYAKLGKEKFNNDIHYQNIINKMSGVSKEKLDRILSTIETILDE